MTLPPELPTVAEAARALAAGETTALALTEAALARIGALNPTLSAFIMVDAEGALASASQLDQERAAGQLRGPLHGVPVALKDNIDQARLPTTAHSRLRAGHVAPEDAHVTALLRAGGAVLMGKLALHEFARGGPGDDHLWPDAKNPWNTGHSCGGSSSGSAVATAAGMVSMAVGTDTGGSIRYPAGCCNLVGIKPTYGLISRRGVVPLSFSLDTVGPLTRSVEDCALSLQVMAGFDPDCAGSVQAPPADYTTELKRGIEGMRIGYARSYDRLSGVKPEQVAAMDQAADTLARLGAEVVEVDLPERRLMDAATWTIMLAEGFALHRKTLSENYDDYGQITRERLSVGAFVSGAQLVQAMRLRRQFTRIMDRTLAGFDAVICSTSAGGPPLMEQVDRNPWRHTHPITAPFNLTGHPALAVPVGRDAAGMPMSLSVVGPAFSEARLLRIARSYEQAAGWHLARPPLEQ